MSLTEWAARWGVPPQGLLELGQMLTETVAPPPRPIRSEAGVQSAVRLEAAAKKQPTYLWRNNNGALLDKTGRLVRFGLGNDNKDINAILKSSDLIGIEQVLITPQHVGSVIGRFVSRECKEPDWAYTGTDREVAQLRFITLINANGGNAAFVTAEGSL